MSCFVEKSWSVLFIRVLVFASNYEVEEIFTLMAVLFLLKRFVLLWSKVAEHFVLKISELFCWKSLLFRGIFCFEFWRWGDYFFHPPGASESCSLGSWQNETDLNWLKNQVKVVGEREILASLVEYKHNSMAETIWN